MADVRLKVIPKPAEGTAPVIRTDKGKDFVFIKGAGPDNLLCGNCGKILCEKMTLDQIRGVVFECPNCGAFNLT